MAAVISDFAVETAYAAPSTGTVSLGGALSGLKTLVTALGTGVVIRYAMFTATKNKWEKGYGTLTTGSPSTLTRTLIDSSTGSLIDWQPGDLPIYIAPIVSGDEVASMRSNFRLATAPTAPLQAGMRWDDSTSVTAVAAKRYDGVDWTTFMTFNETANAAIFNDFKGANVASASSCDIWTPADGVVLHITGTTGITGFATAPQAGARRTVIVDSALTITAGTNVVLPGKKDLAVAPGTILDIVADTTAIAVVTPRTRVSVPAGDISGWACANNAGDATNDLDIAVGAGADATGVYWIATAALTKQSDVAWAVGTGNGGLDTGAVGNSDYYIWAIARSDTGVTDILYSLSSTAPTMPASYDYKRLIGWIKRVGGTIVPFTTLELPGGGLQLMWVTPTIEKNVSTLSTTRITDAAKVPLNLKTQALLRVTISNASAPVGAVVCDPAEADLAPNIGASPGCTHYINSANHVDTKDMEITTSATGTIAARSDTASTIYRFYTRGFRWSRR